MSQLKSHQSAYRRHEAETLLAAIAKRAKELEELEKARPSSENEARVHEGILAHLQFLQRRDAENLELVQKRMRRLA